MSIMSTGLGGDEKRLVARQDSGMRRAVQRAKGIDPDLPVRYVSIRTWCRISGLGKSTTYELLAEHQLRAVKVGNKTLIDLPAGLAYLDALPAPQVTTGLKRRAERRAAATARVPRKRGRPARSFSEPISEATPAG